MKSPFQLVGGPGRQLQRIQEQHQMFGGPELESLRDVGVISATRLENNPAFPGWHSWESEGPQNSVVPQTTVPTLSTHNSV